MDIYIYEVVYLDFFKNTSWRYAGGKFIIMVMKYFLYEFYFVSCPTFIYSPNECFENCPGTFLGPGDIFIKNKSILKIMTF